MENSVFKRTETTAPLISETLFNLLIGLTLVWGFAVNWVILDQVDIKWLLQINPIIFS